MDKKITKANERRKQVKKRTTELLSFYSSADVDKIKTYRSLIEHLAFVDVMLLEYQEDIIENGFQVEYQNGKNQWGLKRNEAVDLFKKWYSERLTDAGKLRGLLDLGDEIEDDDFDVFIRRKNSL